MFCFPSLREVIFLLVYATCVDTMFHLIAIRFAQSGEGHVEIAVF